MSFPNSAGAYTRIQDRSFIMSGSGAMSGGIVLSSDRGTTDPNIVTNAQQFIDTYGYPNRDNPSMYAAMRFLRRANFLTVKRVINDAVVATGELTDAEPTTPTTQLEIVAENAGAWGNDITVTIEEGGTELAADTFYLVVLEDDVEAERFVVSRDPLAVNGFGRSVFVEDVVNEQSKLIRVTDISDGSATYGDTTTDLTGGEDDSTAPDEATIVGAWDDFLNTENVSSKLLINAGWATQAVQQKMLSVAQSRRDAFAILDVPQEANDDAQAMVTYRNDTLMADSYHGALYGGWLKILDQNSGFRLDIPSSGDVAANFVQGAARAEIWEAVMGLDLGSIPNTLGTTKVFSEGERDLLYTNGINPVTKIGTNAAVIWGQKTLQQVASGLDRANVVMNVKDMDVRIKDSLLPFVGKPQTETYRNSANYLVTSFLENRKRRGGLYDYFVDTSEQINTPNVLDNNQFLLNVFVKPTKTMEFIRATLIVTPTGVDFANF
jgi:phage tail sheath protein FI